MTSEQPSPWEHPARSRPRRGWLGAAVAVAVVVGVAMGWGTDDDSLSVDEATDDADSEPGEDRANAEGSPLADEARWRLYADPDHAAAVAPTPEGGVWVGTYGAGLVRWDADGDDYRRHLTQRLAGPRVEAVAVAPDGTVWVTAPREPGVHRYDGDGWTTHTPDDGLPHDEVLSLAAADGVVWAGTDGGLARFADGEWTTFAEELPHLRVPSVAVAADGAVWAVTGKSGGPYGGLVRFDDGGWTVWERGEHFGDDRVVDVATGPDGGVWLITEGMSLAGDHPDGGHRLLRRDGEAWTVAADRDELPVSRLHAFTVDAAGVPWGAFDDPSGEGDGVVWRFDGKLRTADAADHGLPGPVRALAGDERGRLWAATPAGVARFAEGEWTRYATGEGPSGPLTSVALSEGTVWVGGTSGRRPIPRAFAESRRTDAAVSRFDDGQWTTWTGADGLPDGSVVSLAVGPDGTVWAATAGPPPGTEGASQGGVARYDGSEWEAVDDGLDHDHVPAISVADDGTVWAIVVDEIESGQGPVPEQDGGLARFDGHKWDSWTETGPMADRVPRSLAVDGAGNVWLSLWDTAGPGGPAPGSEEGVARFDGDEWERFTTDDGLPESRVSALTTGESAVWAATPHSLLRFDGQRWVEQGTTDEFERFMEALIVDDGAVWAASHTALSRFDGQRWATAELDELPVRHIGAITAGDEALWLATPRGLARFDRDRP